MTTWLRRALGGVLLWSAASGAGAAEWAGPSWEFGYWGGAIMDAEVGTLYDALLAANVRAIAGHGGAATLMTYGSKSVDGEVAIYGITAGRRPRGHSTYGVSVAGNQSGYVVARGTWLWRGVVGGMASVRHGVRTTGHAMQLAFGGVSGKSITARWAADLRLTSVLAGVAVNLGRPNGLQCQLGFAAGPAKVGGTLEGTLWDTPSAGAVTQVSTGSGRLDGVGLQWEGSAEAGIPLGQWSHGQWLILFLGVDLHGAADFGLAAETPLDLDFDGTPEVANGDLLKGAGGGTAGADFSAMVYRAGFRVVF